ncbi:MAG TPA: 5-oxoprolinase subunit PxpB [Ilumatobacteraceae bacterium]|jgi:KipI family sensor histidine kinase inhibitor|nr:5-oxoprolinase subunit PxpB [Ilumatobacteraceae bacterium]
MRLLPCGSGAVLAEYDTLAEVMAVDDALRVANLPGIDDVIPAARTVLVAYHNVDRAALERLLIPAPAAPRPQGPIVEVPVVYDGIDLDEVAEATGLSTDEVVATHSSVVYSAAFLGFTPGWAYLVGLPAQLHLPRRSTPRTSITAGSVAIANEFTGVYPTVSPGGWHLLGHTTERMFDVERDKPALVMAGDRVRFVRT